MIAINCFYFCCVLIFSKSTCLYAMAKCTITISHPCKHCMSIVHLYVLWSNCCGAIAGTKYKCTPQINDYKYYVCKYAHTKSYTAIACVHNASKYLCLKIVIVISLRFDVVAYAAALDST